jgi:thiol-disulfide isomerase/thioredoxin
MMILLLFAFVSGLITILAPCIWPLLPLVLSSSSTGGKRKPLGITLGMIASFAFFTLTLSYVVKSVHLNPDMPRFLAVVIIGFLGLSMVIPALSFKVEAILSRLSGYFSRTMKPTSSGLLDMLPSYAHWQNTLEGHPLVQAQLETLLSKNAMPTASATLPNLGPAQDFVGITHWLNTSTPLSLSQLRGKVVLVDFWTYACINCLRTLPYVTSLYEKYKETGFMVIGVHTPEFEYEKRTANVERALQQYKIHYPVAQDNDYATWNAYHNRFWPAQYVIDTQGNIRMVHTGEGAYEEIEMAVKVLLREAGNTVL